MNIEEKREIVIARLIANTRRKKRPNNLIEIANDITWLSNDMGSLDAVSQIVGVSSEMLRKFLSVYKLSEETRKLVEIRKIDSVTVVHLIRDFDSNSQLIIANEVIAGRLSADDMKVLVPLRNSLPDLNINQLILRVQKSRDFKVYVIYFMFPSMLKDVTVLETQFKKIVPETEVVSFSVKNKVGTLELTSAGLKKLREAAKERNLSLRKFVDMIVLEK